MLAIVVNFPNEATQLDHMHRVFHSRPEADDWLQFLDDFFGPLEVEVFLEAEQTYCPRCLRLLSSTCR